VSIERYEAELGVLGGLPKQPAELAPRVRWLLEKIAGAHRRLDGYESKMGELKKVLKGEY
jgi:hypothetical protein